MHGCDATREIAMSHRMPPVLTVLAREAWSASTRGLDTMRARCGEKAGQRQHPQEAPKPLENCIPQGVSHDQRCRDHNARK